MQIKMRKKMLALFLSSTFFLSSCSLKREVQIVYVEVPQQTTKVSEKIEETKNIETTMQIDKQSDSLEQELSNEEQVVVSKFDALYKEVEDSLKTNGTKALDIAKTGFIYCVDFLFFDTEINGYTFSELSEQAKQDTLNTINRMDELIMSYSPNYKETISDLAKGAYNKASELIKNGVDDIKKFTKEQLGEENYNSISDAKDDFFAKSKEIISDGLDVASDLFEDGKQYIKNWYEDIKK